MIFFRAIGSTSAARYARPKSTKPPPLIKKYPVTLHLIYPQWDIPTIHEFGSAKEIETFLANSKLFLIDTTTRKAIHRHQIYKIDPNATYDIAGPGLPYGPYREKELSRDQVWDKVFERKTAVTLKEALQAEGQNVIELPRVIRDPVTGMDVGEWELILQASDGSIVFLETKYRMSKTHIDNQFERLSKTLGAMGRKKRPKLYLAAYYWPKDEDCISYARSKGYGIIQPNGSDLRVHFKAEELLLD